MPIFERGGFADTMEVACRWSQVEPVYQAVRKALKSHVVVMAHMSHAYPEGCSIYFSMAGPGSQQAYKRTWEVALQAVLDSGATVTHHHGVGSLKALAATRECGVAVNGWREAKALHDPMGIMNPGRLFVEEEPVTAPPSAEIHAEDGLLRVSAGSSSAERSEIAADLGLSILWPWESLAGPPRWMKSRWQVGWTEVEGAVGDLHCRLGRGPRSAAGPDLRAWLANHANSDLQISIAAVPVVESWMGVGNTPSPWKVALELLRQGFRPAVLTVVEGMLCVGFRGCAAAALGELAGTNVPGGLEQRDWSPLMLPCGPFEYCDSEDPRAVAVSEHGVMRLAEGTS